MEMVSSAGLAAALSIVSGGAILLPWLAIPLALILIAYGTVARAVSWSPMPTTSRVMHSGLFTSMSRPPTCR